MKHPPLARAVTDTTEVRKKVKKVKSNGGNNDNDNIAQPVGTGGLHLCTIALNTNLHSGVPERSPLQSLSIPK